MTEASRRAALALCAALSCTLAQADAPAPQAPASRSTASPDAAAALRLDIDPSPLAAHYEVRIQPGRGALEQRLDWYFVREPGRIALIKGGIEEHWLRDDAGRIRFERVLHELETIAEYGPGELETLGVEADWQALSRLVDPDELARLRVTGRSTGAAIPRVALAGRAASTALKVVWSPTVQLPLSVERRGRAGEVMTMRLVKHASVAPEAWPRPGARSTAYARIDAADFGDMAYEPAVRLAEAIDVRAGWRRPHAHD